MSPRSIGGDTGFRPIGADGFAIPMSSVGVADKGTVKPSDMTLLSLTTHSPQSDDSDLDAKSVRG